MAAILAVFAPIFRVLFDAILGRIFSPPQFDVADAKPKLDRLVDPDDDALLRRGASFMRVD